MEYARPRRTLPMAGLALAAGAVLLAGFALLDRAFAIHCVEATPCVSVEDLADGAPLPEAIHIHDRNGDLLADVAGPRRRALLGDGIPPRLAEAFVAVEDQRFRQHGGVDLRGIARAAAANLVSGDIEEGASTIPMQLVRSVWAEELRSVGPWRRKIIEARTGPRLVDALGHDRVLALYLNAIYMGDGIYGVEEASRHYFGVSADALDAGQTATLVGMTRGPELYHPRRHPERTRARRDVVLGVLAQAGVIDAAEAEAARTRPLTTTDASPRRSARSYLTAAVTREIRAVAPELAGRPGLRVFTTVDPVLQREGEAALAERLAAIESGREGRFTPSDSAPLQGAAVALDPRSGAVRAWVGGRDFAGSEFDRVDQARRQVGSLVKPFLVALAHERGAGILDIVSSDAMSIDVNGTAWSPSDHVDDLRMPIREALIQSSNRAAVHLGRALGPAATRTVGVRVGFRGDIPDVPSAYLGAFEASLLEVTRAYAVFGNGGRLTTPHLLERIEAPDGSLLWERTAEPEGEAALSEVTSFVVLDAMRDVVNRGTAWRVRSAGYQGPVAGKTGTTNEGRDAWFVGLTPDLVAGVWIGFDQPRPIVAGGSGGSLAAPTWGAWMRRAQAGDVALGDAWTTPAGVAWARYDPTTGEAFSADCREGDLPAAVVGTASTRIQSCPGRFRRWAESLWRVVAPRDLEPLAPMSLRRPGGG